ncbi:hypothetical protein [Aliarcobacter butzleri]|uniref:hypothetical protein n=1 Tax=Aliarcobacter butzleri TaxID=28197 RepID=UPI001269FF71|nr:hypothetical protein [Aliarcobacter butzleri]
MNKICFLFLLLISGLAAETKNIPFGIKDICSPIIKEQDLTICFNDKSFKWASYSLTSQENKKNLNPFINKDSKYSTIYSQGFNLITLFDINMEDKVSFVLSNYSIDLFNKANDKANQIINEIISKGDRINIIKGLIINDIKVRFNIENNIYDIPTFYYVVITNIDKKEIVKVMFLDFQKNTVKDISIQELREITNINYLFKIKN